MIMVELLCTGDSVRLRHLFGYPFSDGFIEACMGCERQRRAAAMRAAGWKPVQRES